MDTLLERVREANPAQPYAGDYDELFRSIVATPGDARLARRRPHTITRPRLVLVAVIVFLILAGTALAIHFSGGRSYLVTYARGGEVVSLLPTGEGRAQVVWRCPPRGEWCGDLGGFALAPDGEHLALSLTEIGGTTGNIGLQVVDLQTHTAEHIPAAPAQRRAATQGGTVKASAPLARALVQKLGCFTPGYLAWSPDGRQIAYTCDESAVGRSQRLRRIGRIFLIRPDTTNRRIITTHTVAAFSPTWSPDGTQLAFSTGDMPEAARQPGRNSRSTYHSAVYVIDRDGSHERRVAWGALPAWSPDGKTIAYVTAGCSQAPNTSGRIRLVTPTGQDVTPDAAPCDGMGPDLHPVPGWSPDGHKIAVATDTGLYVMNPNGTDLRRLRRGRFNGGFGGYVRPAWRPNS